MPTPLLPDRPPPGTNMGGGFIMPTPMPVMRAMAPAGPPVPPQASTSMQQIRQYGDQFGGQFAAQQPVQYLGQYSGTPLPLAAQTQSYMTPIVPTAYQAPANASVSSGAAAYMQLMGMLLPGGPKPGS